MKNYIKYIVLILIGILAGWFLFGNSNQEIDQANKKNEENIQQSWTCSMHPNILLPEKGDCPVCGMDLIPAGNDDTGLSVHEFRMSENALALANIETTVVNFSESSSGSLKVTGKIRENEKTNSIQTAHFGGRIEKLHVNSTGEKVGKGQLLASIYSPELVTTQMELLTAAKSKKSDPSIYNAVKNKLRLWKLSDLQIDNLENSKEVINNFPIYANVSGVVSVKLVEEGTYVKEGQGLFLISNLGTVWADFDLYEKQIPLVHIGDELSIKSHANPNEEINSKVSFIDPMMNTNTRTVTVRATINNKNGSLKPGMFIEGIITSSKIIPTEHSSIYIPKTSILWTGKRSVVYLRKPGPEPIFEMRKVTLGSETNEQYEILEGLNSKDEIVTNGTFSVDAAAQLLGKKSMMNSGSDQTTINDENENSLHATSRLEVSSEFKNQLSQVYDHYIDLKDALVNDDASSSQKSSTVLLTSFKNLKTDKIGNFEALTLWKNIDKKLKDAVENISKTENIANQRAHFLDVSNYMIEGLTALGIGKNVYVQYCPMANNDKGGYWLSNEEKIMNPYFGEMMLNCGNVDRLINP